MTLTDGYIQIVNVEPIDDSHPFSPTSLAARGIQVPESYRKEFEAFREATAKALTSTPSTPNS